MSENPRTPDAEQPVDPWLVERLLADPASTGDGDEQALAILLAALRSPASAAELGDRDHYLAAFASAQALRTSPPLSRRKSMLATLLATKAAVAGAVLVTATATAAAAYTGSLPKTLQDAAHHSIGAPAAHDQGRSTKAKAGQKGHATSSPTATPTGTPTGAPSPTGSPAPGHGPKLTGPAAAGLCNAFTKGGLKPTSTAGRALTAAAGGAAHIPAFCATVLKDRAERTQPAGKPSTHPTGKPSTHPTGKPSDKPGAHSTGKPVKTTTAP